MTQTKYKFESQSSINNPEPAMANMVRVQYFDHQGEGGHVEITPIEQYTATHNHNRRGEAKVALLTGVGHGGIGEATARQLCAEGYRVVACDRDEIGGETCHRIEQAGGKIAFILANTSTADGIEKFMAAAERLTSRVDLLVNNAGSAGDTRQDNYRDLTGEGLQRLVADNLTGPTQVTLETLRRFMCDQQSGVVIFLGTHNGQHGAGLLGQLGYGAAKAGLSGLQAVLVAQCGGFVRFGTVRPGIVVTNSPNWQRRRELDPDYEDKEGKYNPMGKLVEPAHVAKAICWLASDEACMANGFDLVVDGGLSAAGVVHPEWDSMQFRETFVASVGSIAEPPKVSKAA